MPRRGWKRCGCTVHVSASIAGEFKRQSTGQWEWDTAREVVAQWESAGAVGNGSVLGFAWPQLDLDQTVQVYLEPEVSPFCAADCFPAFAMPLLAAWPKASGCR